MLPDESLSDRAHRALAAISDPTLLVYDNVPSERELLEWFVPPGLPAHVLVTTTHRDWARSHAVRSIGRLGNEDAHALVASVASEQTAASFGDALVRRAGGIAVQLKADAAFVDYEVRHGRNPRLTASLASDTVSSFEQAFGRLTPDAQLAVRIAALFNEAQIPLHELVDLFTSEGWEAQRTEPALDAIIDRAFVTRTQDALRMHTLVAEFLRARAEPPLPERLVTRHRTAFIQAARAFGSSPGDSTLRGQFAAYPEQIAVWKSIGIPEDDSDLHSVGYALGEMGRFSEAEAWFERAIEAAEKGDIHGRIDHESLGWSLHDVGYCYLGLGQFDAARPWFERAVEAQKKGDVHGRINHESLGKSLHQIGCCYLTLGQFDAARLWFERAIEATEKGDILGRVDHQSLGKSLHQVGYCYSSLGQFDAARPWFERAVEAKKKGDVHGRIDHESLRLSVSSLADCLLKLDQ